MNSPQIGAAAISTNLAKRNMVPTVAAPSPRCSAYNGGIKTNTAVTSVFKPSAGRENPVMRREVALTSLIIDKGYNILVRKFSA
jgi:hypothetical protein